MEEKKGKSNIMSGAVFPSGRLLLACLIMTVISLSACGSWIREPEGGAAGYASQSTPETDSAYGAAGIGIYDSTDTAIVLEKHKDDGTITFWNRNVKRSYTLSYDGTTCFFDKYGESLSIDQVNPGDIVDVAFLKSKKHLTTLSLCPEVWSYEKVTFFEFDTVKGEVTVGQEAKKMKISENTKYFCDGQSIDAMEINSVDTLSFQGIDTEVLTVRIEQGHGYLRLSGDEKFIGGWIEIGQSRIQRISEDMLLPVAEGTYSVLVSKDGNSGEKTAVIRRNEETVLDISDIEVAEPEEGTILFSLTPSSAKLYIDGEKVDASLPISLVYGIHQLIVRADGYQTLTRYIRVGQPSAGLDITLDPVTSGEESSKSSKSETDTSTDYFKVYIDAPEGAEVYLNGSYVGVAPCSFRREEGSQVVTLRRAGYVSKSYTLQIKDEEKDISYSFADLEPTDTSLTQSGDINSLVSDMIGTLFD